MLFKIDSCSHSCVLLVSLFSQSKIPATNSVYEEDNVLLWRKIVYAIKDSWIIMHIYGSMRVRRKVLVGGTKLRKLNIKFPKNVNGNLHSLTHCPRLHSRANRVHLDPWFIQNFGTCQKKTRHKTFRIQTQNTNLGPLINQNEKNFCFFSSLTFNPAIMSLHLFMSSWSLILTTMLL